VLKIISKSLGFFNRLQVGHRGLSSAGPAGPRCLPRFQVATGMCRNITEAMPHVNSVSLNGMPWLSPLANSSRASNLFVKPYCDCQSMGRGSISEWQLDANLIKVPHKKNVENNNVSAHCFMFLSECGVVFAKTSGFEIDQLSFEVENLQQ
jgi:hypothetical protein